jgi:hypothetical protein
MRRLLTAALASLVLVCTAHSADPEVVSLIRLIAAPQQYDGKRVVVIGVPRIDFESYGLYLHKEDFDQGLTKNALWIVVPNGKDDEWKALEGQYVLVDGTFSVQNTGHMGMYSGAIGKITRFRAVKRENVK